MDCEGDLTPFRHTAPVRNNRAERLCPSLVREKTAKLLGLISTVIICRARSSRPEKDSRMRRSLRLRVRRLAGKRTSCEDGCVVCYSPYLEQKRLQPIEASCGIKQPPLTRCVGIQLLCRKQGT